MEATMGNLTVEEQKRMDKEEKDRLIKMIVVYQQGTAYTEESLAGKTLKRLREIYDKAVH